GSGQQAEGALWLALRERLGPTSLRGYDELETVGTVLAIVREGHEGEPPQAGESVTLLVDRTPFYAESGGQAGDRGRIDWPGGAGEVLDVQKEAGDLHAPVVKTTEGVVELG